MALKNQIKKNLLGVKENSKILYDRVEIYKLEKRFLDKDFFVKAVRPDKPGSDICRREGPRKRRKIKGPSKNNLQRPVIWRSFQILVFQRNEQGWGQTP